MLTPAPSKATFKSVRNYKSERWIGLCLCPPFSSISCPFSSLFLPRCWVRVSGGDRGGLICMLVEKWGLGSLGGGQVGYRRGGGGAKPRPPLHLLHTHTKQKIWIHQNLLGHGCSNSPQAARLGSSSSDPAIFLWFLHGCQITLPPPQELRFVSVCWCMCDLAYEHRAMGHYTSTGPDRTAQKRLRRGEAAAMFFQF